MWRILLNDYTEATRKRCLSIHQNKLKQKAEDLLRQGKFPKGVFEARETKFNKFSEVKMRGEAFQRNTTNILDYLGGNQVSRLGICGMGGVVIEKANYGNVLWITVSQDSNPQRLQGDIWEALGLGTLHVKDVRKRAAMLSDCLTKRKSTVILDDMWKYFNLE